MPDGATIVTTQGQALIAPPLPDIGIWPAFQKTDVPYVAEEPDSALASPSPLMVHRSQDAVLHERTAP